MTEQATSFRIVLEITGNLKTSHSRSIGQRGDHTLKRGRTLAHVMDGCKKNIQDTGIILGPTIGHNQVTHMTRQEPVPYISGDGTRVLEMLPHLKV